MIRSTFRITAALALIAHLALCQGSVLLVGGGGEDYNDWSDVPYRWLVQHAANRHILVLHYSTGSSFLPSYFQWLGASSATNLVVSSTTLANDSSTFRSILAADGLFLRGGDQWQYVRLWKGTLAEEAIRQVFQRGGVVGGTSAGMAVLSEIIFDARVTSVDPRSALRNPLSSGITFTEGFLGFVPGIVGDTHFYERGRLGRLLAMISLYKQQTGKTITGVGVDYNTALAIEPDGTGEVMGAGTVTAVRLEPTSSCTLETGKPLALTDVHFDQLTAGYNMTIATGQIHPPVTALPFVPRQVHMNAASLILDGSAAVSSWTVGAGSLNRFLTLLPSPKDTVGIVSSPWSPAGVASVASFLSQQGVPSLSLGISEATKNDPLMAARFAASAGFVFVGNREDSLAGYFASSLVGSVLSAKLASGLPVVMLSNDCKLAADTAVGKTEFHAYAAYYGYMTLLKGLGLINGVACMPRVYEHPDSIDNRCSGLMWEMGKSQMAYGVLLDDGSHIVLTNNLRLSIAGATPAIVVDGRKSTSTDFPLFTDPGKQNPRQNAALVGGAVHVVRAGQTFDLQTGTVAGIGELRTVGPSEFFLAQNYPNPFNATTTLEFGIVKQEPVKLVVYDVLGREVAFLVDRQLSAGTHTVRFDGTHQASGVYFYRLVTPSFTQSKKLILLK